MKVRKTSFHLCCWCTDYSSNTDVGKVAAELTLILIPLFNMGFGSKVIGLFWYVALQQCFHPQGTARDANQEMKSHQNSRKTWFEYFMMWTEQHGGSIVSWSIKRYDWMLKTGIIDHFHIFIHLLSKDYFSHPDHVTCIWNLSAQIREQNPGPA